MSLSITTNIAALIAQRNVSRNNSNLSSTLNKLSSGLRINSASDDSSGMIIADSLKSQNLGLGQAIRNANDGVSMLQIADGALQESVDIINTIKQKSIQAASDTQTYETRTAIQNDIDKLLEEYDIISNSTSFNGQNLLTGKFTNKQIQVGAYSNETAFINISSNLSKNIGHTTTSSVFPEDVGEIRMTALNNITGKQISTKEVDLQYNNDPENGLGAVADEINRLTELTDIKAIAVVASQSSVSQGETGNEFTINGITIGNIPVKNGDSNNALVSAINKKKLETGVEASITSEGDLFLKSTDGRAIKVEGVQDPPIKASSLTTLGELKLINKGFNQYDISLKEPEPANESTEEDRNDFTLISEIINENEAAVDTTDAQISANGEYIVFSSSADNLVAGDTDGRSDVFLYNVKTGETSLLSTNVGNAEATSASIDDSGRYITFWAKTSAPCGNVHLHDTVTGITTRIDNNAIHGSYQPTISGDGRYVVFSSESDNIISGDDNNASTATDIIMYDAVLDKYILISNKDGDGDPSDGGWMKGKNRNPSVSEDGRYVVFESTNNDPSSASANNTDSSNTIFLRDTLNNTTTVVSKNTSGTAGAEDSTNAKISGDGKYIVYESNDSDLVANDTNGAKDIFLYNTLTGETTLISTAQDGAQGNADSFNSSISKDGKYVVFASDADNLTANDTNGVSDVFAYNIETGEINRVSEINEDTGGDGASGDSLSYYSTVSISNDGQYVVFDSASTNLLSTPTSGTKQIYMTELNTNEEEESVEWINLELHNKETYCFCDIDVTTLESAQLSMEIADATLECVEKIRSSVGSSQNQLESTISNLSTTQINVSSSESAIRDADFAEESKVYAQMSVLTQTSTFALAQANEIQKEMLQKLLQ